MAKIDRQMQLVRETVAASVAAKERFLETGGAALIAAAAETSVRLGRGGKLRIFGNGGSAADAQNLASELVNRMCRERPGIAAIALTTDSSVVTSIANDHAYERVFARQIETLARPEDVAVAFTTSGNSPNVVAGLAAAAGLELLTVGFLGKDGGKCRTLCRHPLVVPVESTERIQEVHMLMTHLFATLIEDALHPR
jgi:D-sedoheptulose 7-phosphate isomerase